MDLLVGASAVLLGTLVICWPELKWLVRGRRTDGGIEGGPEDFDRNWDEYLVFEPRFRELEELGFQRRGICWGRFGFLGGREFVFADPARHIHAIVSKHWFEKRGSLPNVTFETAFTNAALVITRAEWEHTPKTDLPHLQEGGMYAPCVPRPQSEPTFWRGPAGHLLIQLVGIFFLGAGCFSTGDLHITWTCVLLGLGVMILWRYRHELVVPPAQVPVDFTLADALAEHEARVARFVHTGYQPVTDDSLAGLCNIEELSRHYHPWTVPYLFAVKLPFVLFLPLMTACLLGWLHPAVWLIWFAEAMVLAAMRYFFTFQPRQ